MNKNYIVVSIAAVLLLVAISRAILNHPFEKEEYNTTLDDAAMGFLINRNKSILDAGITRQYNSHGFADIEFSEQKEEDVYRVLVIGDSFTYGYGNLANETYPKLLEKKLNARSKKRYELYNLGLSGLGTYLEYGVLAEVAVDLDPDMIIVGFFMNDFDIMLIPEQENCLKTKENRIKNGARYAFNIARYFPLNREDMYFLGQYMNNDRGWNCFMEGLRRIHDLSSEKNVSIVFVDVTLANKGHKFYPGITEKTDYEIGRYFRMYHVDIPTEFGSDMFDSLFNEFRHYSLMGNEVIAESISTQIFNSSAILQG
jgi:lysophospholipase L1-like esterase